MSSLERADHKTRFKRGRSGNPQGRPRGQKNSRSIIEQVLFKPIHVTENGSRQKVPKIVAAFQVCMNNALKGDARSLSKVFEIAHKYGLLDQVIKAEDRIGAIEITIVDPKHPELNGPAHEYNAKKAEMERRKLKQAE